MNNHISQFESFRGIILETAERMKAVVYNLVPVDGAQYIGLGTPSTAPEDRELARVMEVNIAAENRTVLRELIIRYPVAATYFSPHINSSVPFVGWYPPEGAPLSLPPFGDEDLDGMRPVYPYLYLVNHNNSGYGELFWFSRLDNRVQVAFRVVVLSDLCANFEAGHPPLPEKALYLHYENHSTIFWELQSEPEAWLKSLAGESVESSDEWSDIIEMENDYDHH